jgi:UDP-N-acetylmuramoyl-L-alanyl-D-glutamate--2,6-diaminopimelate ligase
MVAAGIACFMEVSSHGIHQGQKRFNSLGGVFTNLSDHLDYHPTFAEYRDVKKIVF